MAPGTCAVCSAGTGGCQTWQLEFDARGVRCVGTDRCHIALLRVMCAALEQVGVKHGHQGPLCMGRCLSRLRFHHACILALRHASNTCLDGAELFHACCIYPAWLPMFMSMRASPCFAPTIQNCNCLHGVVSTGFWCSCHSLGEWWLQTNRRTSGLLSMVTSAMVGFAPEDPMGGRFLVQRSLVGK